MSDVKRVFNHKPDRSRIGDEHFKCHFPIHPMVMVQHSLDLRPYDIPIFDQDRLGSCTANAGAGLWGFTERLALSKDVKNEPLIFPGGYKDISRLMLYFLARVLAGDVGQDGGAELRDITAAFARWGICPEEMWPYDESKVLISPPHECYGTAWHHKDKRSFRITDGDLEEMKTCLIQGYPFIFGFTVYESFQSQYVANTGIVPLPQPGERILGGHAVEAIGFDDARQWFVIRNSWGSAWGDSGYCYMPYAYLANPNIASDFWTMIL